MTKTEHQHRLAYAERQFQLYLARAEHSNLKGKLAMEMGDFDTAKKEFGIAGRHLAFVSEVNETIDTHRRALDDVSEGKVHT